MNMHAFYIKNPRTGKYHAGASYGGRWTKKMAQLFTRKHDAERRQTDLIRRQTRHSFDPDNLPDDDLQLLEVDVELL